MNEGSNDRQQDAEETCDLCGLPNRGGAVELERLGTTYHFCCRGCRQVFLILSQSPDTKDVADFRSTEIFQKCLEMGIIPKVPPGSDEKPPMPSSEIPFEHTLQLNLFISGMWCPACAWLLDETVGQLDGVIQTNCLFSTDTLRCEYDPTRTSPGEIIERIRKIGYHAELPGDVLELKNDRKELIRFGVSAFLTMNVMMLSVALYSGFFQNFSIESISSISIPIFCMASVVFFYGGQHIHRRACQAWRSGAYGMETLISLGSGAAYCYSIWGLLEGSLHLYFDTSAMLISLVLLGKLLEHNAKKKVQADLSHFLNLWPKKVRLCTPGSPDGQYVSTEVLRKGDIFRLEAGEIAPADGAIVRGEGIVDESHLTGEPVPKVKKTGGRLVSGATLSSGTLLVKADQVGNNATLGRMIELIEDALVQKTPLESWTDRLLRWFVPGVVLLSIMTVCIGTVLGLTLDQAFIRAITVLVISCPCALGIAIPLVRVAGLSIAGRNGILVRDFSAFDRAGDIGRIIFDKTGTITKGSWRLLDIRSGNGFEDSTVMAIASGLEKGAEHVVALEIQRWAKEKNIKPLTIEKVKAFENGISGVFEGKKVKIGAEAFVINEKKSPRMDENPVASEKLNVTARSKVYLSVGGELAAVFSFGDDIRPEAVPAVEALANKGVKHGIVSGDGEATTRFVASQVGIEDVWGDKFPRDKLQIVKNLQAAGERVAMVGDGVNDAPALAQADLAIAMKAGNPLGKETADITLMRGDLTQIHDFIIIASAVRKKVYQNLTFTFIYNVVSIPIAMSGLLSPLIAVCAMLLSSLSVIGNTLLLIRKYGDGILQK